MSAWLGIFRAPARRAAEYEARALLGIFPASGARPSTLVAGRGDFPIFLQAFPRDPLQVGAVLVGEDRHDRFAVGVEGGLPIARRQEKIGGP